MKRILFFFLLAALAFPVAAQTSPQYMEVLRGYNPYGISFVHKYGENLDVDAAEDVISIGGDAGYITTNSTVVIASDSATDTWAGIGAKLIVLSGLDENWDSANETINMTGTTNVTSTTRWQRVNRAWVTTAGTANATNSNYGTISVYDDGASAAAVMQIDPGAGQTLHASWTVPDDKEAYITAWGVDIQDAQLNNWARIAIMTRATGEGWRIRSTLGGSNTGASVTEKQFTLPTIVLAARTDVKIRVLSVASTDTDIAGWFDVVVYDK